MVRNGLSAMEISRFLCRESRHISPQIAIRLGAVRDGLPVALEFAEFLLSMAEQGRAGRIFNFDERRASRVTSQTVMVRKRYESLDTTNRNYVGATQH
jgi:hypothetical protein